MKEAVLPDRNSGWRGRAADYLALEHNVTIASAAVFLIGFGEELWKKFLPKYLEALGASTPIIGLFGTAEDFFDACYQYPGGFVADRFGTRRAFLIFITLASLGYLVYLFSTSWPLLFVGLALVMAWQAMASPAIFAVIGDSLPRERRAMGFTLQSILKRVPVVISPLVGGVLIASMGLVAGVHVGLLITLALAAVTIVLVLKIRTPNEQPQSINMRGVWRTFHGVLKRLLISDIIIRTCEGMTVCRADVSEFCRLSRSDCLRFKLCVADLRLCDRWSARNRRAFKKGDPQRGLAVDVLQRKVNTMRRRINRDAVRIRRQ
jgi:MFS family permease